MRYFMYTAILQDGESTEDVCLCIGVPEKFMIRFGFVWLVERIVLALRKRVKFDMILSHHVEEIEESQVADHTDTPWIHSDSWLEERSN